MNTTLKLAILAHLALTSEATRTGAEFGEVLTLRKAEITRQVGVDAMALLDEGYARDETERMAKSADAMQTSLQRPIVPEDLEPEAFNIQWDPGAKDQMLALRMLPSIDASAIEHEVARVLSYGDDDRPGNSGFVNELGVPKHAPPRFDRRIETVKLMATQAPTSWLSTQEATVKALGESRSQAIAKRSAMLRIMRKEERAIWFSDNSATRNNDRFKGILQQIGDEVVNEGYPEEHVIDMRGEPLTEETVAAKMTDSQVFFDVFNSLVMDARTRHNFERSLDGSERLQFPVASSPLMLGRHIAGIQTGGHACAFFTNNIFMPEHRGGQYKDSRATSDCPNYTPTVTAGVAQADGATTDSVVSRWDTPDDVFYVITAVEDELEGLGVRYPAGASLLSVSAGEEVELTVNAGSAGAESLRVYRGNEDGGTDATDAWFIFEVATSATGAPVTIFDNNIERPNTGIAFGLNLISPMTEAYLAVAGSKGQAQMQAEAKLAAARSMQTRGAGDKTGNTVVLARLGPALAELELARLVLTATRPALVSALTPVVRYARTSYVFKNIGRDF